MDRLGNLGRLFSFKPQTNSYFFVGNTGTDVTEKEREKRPEKGENSEHRIREFPIPGVLCFV